MHDKTGELAAQVDDPVMFLGYWNNPQATRNKIKQGWFCTGDMGYRDEDGAKKKNNVLEY